MENEGFILPYSPRAVANYFIGVSLCRQSSLNPMQVQKLVYVAAGRHLCDQGMPLVSEAFEAWRWGPVLPSLYYDLKRFGGSVITHPIFSFRGNEFWVATVSRDDTFVADLLERVWRSFGRMSAIQLSELMHVNDSPWSFARRRAGVRSGESSNVKIDDNLISAYFSKNFKC